MPLELDIGEVAACIAAAALVAYSLVSAAINISKTPAAAAASESDRRIPIHVLDSKSTTNARSLVSEDFGVPDVGFSRIKKYPNARKRKKSIERY